MAEIVVKDRVKETASAPGTGTITLTGPADGFQTFNAIGDGNQTYFTIVDSSSGDWEVNYGTYTSLGTTLTRNATPLSSSNSGNLVNFTGTVDVFCTYPAEKAIYEEINGDTIINGGPITILGTGVTSTPATTFDSTVGQMFSNVDSFSQLYNQNLSSLPLASSDFVAYNDQSTTGEEFYVDMGINSSTFDDATTYPIFPFNSAYLYSAGVDGGTVGQNADLYIGTGTSNSDVVLFAGGLDKPNIAGVLKSADGAWVLKDGSTALTTNTGEKLQVYGTAKITGAVGLSAPITTSSSMVSPGSTELVTRSYVDSATSTAFTVHTAVRAATTSNLSANYANGTAGVGATLTADTNREFTTLDGVTGWSVGQRVLIKNQTTAYENGAYTVTDLGSTGVSPWVLTRATDFDTAGAGEIANNAYFYVTAGTTNAGSSWVLNQTAAITVGTTSLPFDLFAAAQVYTGGTNINVSGGVISLTGTVAATNGGTGYASYTAGQLLYADTTTSLAPLNIGAQYQSLVSNGTSPTWGQVNLSQSAAITGTLLATNGGTGQATYATGDTLYSSATNTLSKLSGNTSTTKKFMTQTGTGSGSAAPSWDVVNGADVNGNISGSAGSVANALTAGTYMSAAGTFDGSVARTFSVNATPNNTFSTVVARDGSGNFTATTITAALTGNASTATSLAGGGTNTVVYQSLAGTSAFLANGTTGQVLTATTGSAPSWQTPTAASKSYAQAMRILGI